MIIETKILNTETNEFEPVLLNTNQVDSIYEDGDHSVVSFLGEKNLGITIDIPFHRMRARVEPIGFILLTSISREGTNKMPMILNPAQIQHVTSHEFGSLLSTTDYQVRVLESLEEIRGLLGVLPAFLGEEARSQ